MTSNSSISKKALKALDDNWLNAIIFFILYLLTAYSINFIFSKTISTVINLLIGGPLMVGVSAYFLNLINKNEFHLMNLFQGFHNFINVTITYLLAVIFTFLGLILFVVPGIIIAISLSQIFYIMIENPRLTPIKVLQKSKTMMEDHKAQYFRLILRFLGWSILCLLTFGIGFLILWPYVQSCIAIFYNQLKQQTP